MLSGDVYQANVARRVHVNSYVNSERCTSPFQSLSRGHDDFARFSQHRFLVERKKRIEFSLTENDDIMTTFHKSILGILFAGIATFPVSAATISDISFTSNFGVYINDTIVNGTSPLAFTADTGLAQPFLNAADSTITLGNGDYYAIAFLGVYEQVGPGTISFMLNGVDLYSQIVTFPDPTFASGVFASFALPGGDFVTVSATGLSADRIRVLADGSGLGPDGAPDAFYQFNFFTQGSDVPEPATGVLLVAGLATALAVRRRHLAR